MFCFDFFFFFPLFLNLPQVLNSRRATGDPFMGCRRSRKGLRGGLVVVFALHPKKWPLFLLTARGTEATEDGCSPETPRLKWDENI